MLLFLLFIGIPLIEIALFIAMGDLIGFWPSILIVLITAVIGTVVFRSQGLNTMHALQADIGSGRDPTQHIIHGALILIAGVILCLPGYFTDTIGFLLLFAPVRDWAISKGAASFAARSTVFATNSGSGFERPSAREDRTIDDVEYTVLDENDPKNTRK